LGFVLQILFRNIPSFPDLNAAKWYMARWLCGGSACPLIIENIGQYNKMSGATKIQGL